jgi:hypothetical protein
MMNIKGEGPNLYAMTVQFLIEHEDTLLKTLERHIVSLQAAAIVDHSEAAAGFVVRVLYPAIGAEAVRKYTEKYPGYFHTLPKTWGEDVSVTDGMLRYMKSVVQAILRRWDSRFHYQEGLLGLCVRELLATYADSHGVERRTVWRVYIAKAREDFFVFYPNDEGSARKSGWYAWMMSDDAMAMYLTSGKYNARIECVETTNVYLWAYNFLTARMQGLWKSNTDEIPF